MSAPRCKPLNLTGSFSTYFVPFMLIDAGNLWFGVFLMETELLILILRLKMRQMIFS